MSGTAVGVNFRQSSGSVPLWADATAGSPEADAHLTAILGVYKQQIGGCRLCKLHFIGKIQWRDEKGKKNKKRFCAGANTYK